MNKDIYETSRNLMHDYIEENLTAIEEEEQLVEGSKEWNAARLALLEGILDEAFLQLESWKGNESIRDAGGLDCRVMANLFYRSIKRLSEETHDNTGG
mgnify:CR=1 FL=1|jgi:hypothetical protein